jgi:lysozyme
MRHINKRGRDLIKEFEGFRATPYLCSAGYATIGYGHTIKDSHGRMMTNLAKAKAVCPGPISKAQAEQLLDVDLDGYEDAIDDLVTVPLNDNQFAALVSFTYNLGIRAFANSTLRARLNRGNYASVPGQLNRWVHSRGRRERGLIRRRKAEGDLWNLPGHTEAQPKVA